jgi:sugar lactone lactonase YvrE
VRACVPRAGWLHRTRERQADADGERRDDCSLFRLDDVVITPHAAYYSEEAIVVGNSSVTTPQVTAWSLEPGLLSEGPRWHEERQELLWVDILGRRFHRATLTNGGRPGRVRTMAFDRHVGAVAPAAGGGYVLAAGQGFIFVDEDGSVREAAQPEAGHVDVRMNDGACDPQGRFWAGTMAYDESPGAGTLYRLELDGRCSTVLTGLTISNGIGWSPDGATMYLSDSGTGCVDAFDFDADTGAIAGRRTLVRIDEPGMAPDGLAVDEQGDMWVGIYGGWAVNRYRPDGSLLATVRIPAAQATSCAFGGRDGRTLFVTTGRERLEDAELERQPEAGRVFAVTGLGTRGPGCAPYRGQVV